MRVINLLPWREALYQRNRLNFILTLSGVACFVLMLALLGYWHGRSDRMAFATELESLQARLLDLQQEHISISQTSDEIADINNLLLLKKLAWMQQSEWQQQMQVWQLLARDARISAIAWSGEEITLRAVSKTTDPVRKLIHSFPGWELKQIELNAQSEYQVLISNAFKNEVSY